MDPAIDLIANIISCIIKESRGVASGLLPTGRSILSFGVSLATDVSSVPNWSWPGWCSSYVGAQFIIGKMCAVVSSAVIDTILTSGAVGDEVVPSLVLPWLLSSCSDIGLASRRGCAFFCSCLVVVIAQQDRARSRSEIGRA